MRKICIILLNIFLFSICFADKCKLYDFDTEKNTFFKQCGKSQQQYKIESYKNNKFHIKPFRDKSEHFLTFQYEGLVCGETKDFFDFDRNSKIFIAIYFTSETNGVESNFRFLDENDNLVYNIKIPLTKNWNVYAYDMDEEFENVKIEFETNINKNTTFAVEFINIYNSDAEEFCENILETTTSTEMSTETETTDVTETIETTVSTTDETLTTQSLTTEYTTVETTTEISDFTDLTDTEHTTEDENLSTDITSDETPQTSSTDILATTDETLTTQSLTTEYTTVETTTEISDFTDLTDTEYTTEDENLSTDITSDETPQTSSTDILTTITTLKSTTQDNPTTVTHITSTLPSSSSEEETPSTTSITTDNTEISTEDHFTTIDENETTSFTTSISTSITTILPQSEYEQMYLLLGIALLSSISLIIFTMIFACNTKRHHRIFDISQLFPELITSRFYSRQTSLRKNLIYEA